MKKSTHLVSLALVVNVSISNSQCWHHLFGIITHIKNSDSLKQSEGFLAIFSKVIIDAQIWFRIATINV